MGTKLLLDVGVCAAWFLCKIWTKGRWYFLLVALYYCKISANFNYQGKEQKADCLDILICICPPLTVSLSHCHWCALQAIQCFFHQSGFLICPNISLPGCNLSSKTSNKKLLPNWKILLACIGDPGRPSKCCCDWLPLGGGGGGGVCSLLEGGGLPPLAPTWLGWNRLAMDLDFMGFSLAPPNQLGEKEAWKVAFRFPNNCYWI